MTWTPFLQAGAMAFFLGVGLLHPRVKQGLFVPETTVNLVTGGLLFLVRILLVLGLSRLALVPNGVVDGARIQSPGLQFAVAFLMLDFTRYWVHRADHRVAFLWRFHRVHHSSERLNATSGLRMHVVDLLQLSAIPGLLYFLLLDVSSFAPWVIPGALAVGIVFDSFQHANIAMNMEKPFNQAFNVLLNNPHFHSWHHTRDGHLRDGNYSNVLVIWDRLFGTQVTQEKPPESLGLPAEQQLEQGVLGLQFMRLKKRA
jgi:sterol desaturase/sphingolipid hydroxylase (fatty acid hydroxylase superfamily)